ncbi:phage head closure protein [Paenibacillus cymbidii]|uniref:phage head closure protein n=1 Tax=Paenibacillus cymbidii TaxID=1639034 RepID=UPI001081C684|nr:phage head closure protein [Paenibacillus cymbidii]
MMWRDTVELVTVTQVRDEFNELVDGPETVRSVFANKKSARLSEFYQAHAVGLKPDTVFEIREIEYRDERKVKYGGVEYHIIRTYSKNGEVLELVCSRYPMEG